MSVAGKKLGVLVINFGEPEQATSEQVEPFLERIFLQNAGLEPDEATVQRVRRLASDRAPGLIEEYLKIGGSPLNQQADAQSEQLETDLRARGHDAKTYSAFQFTEPFIRNKVSEAKADGVEILVALPAYPLCGRSTTVQALEDVRTALNELEWAPQFVGVSGWHYHASYTEMRAAHISQFVKEHELNLNDPDTVLYFTVHGTPIQYLDEGNRYDRYVEEHCLQVAQHLGTARYAVGFQNHTNRPIAWTQPDNEVEIKSRPEQRLVMVPISFMHEQSETLSEIDHELRQFVEGFGKEFYRVPVPHSERAFEVYLTDLVEAVIEEERADFGLSPCRCAANPDIWCTNGHRELPLSPYTESVTGL